MVWKIHREVSTKQESEILIQSASGGKKWEIMKVEKKPIVEQTYNDFDDWAVLSEVLEWLIPALE